MGRISSLARFSTAFAMITTLGCGRGDTDSGAPGTDALPGADGGGATDSGSGSDAGPFVCMEDTLEPNTNCQGPALSTSFVNMGPTTFGLCDNGDFYDVQLQQGETETITMTLDPEGGDLDIEIYDALNGCAAVMSSTNAGTASETVTATATAPGTSFRCIRVFPKTPGETNNYTLDVTVL